MSYYFGEINAIHPFREGNGRSKREFIRCLATVAGYELNYAGISQKEMMEASIESFDLKYGKLESLLQQNMRQIPYKEQMGWCDRISPKKGIFSKAYKSYFYYINSVAEDIEKSGFQATDKTVRKMERLHQKVGKELTVSEVHGILNQEKQKRKPWN